MTSSPTIEDYNESKVKNDNITNNDVYKVHFKLINSNNAMANAIRRILLGGLPTVAFDDTYYDNKEESNMIIDKNVSALHNEFIAHRISLLPVCGYKNERLKIVLDYDLEKARFGYAFKNADAVPVFRLKMKNDEDTRKLFGNINIINVDSSMIKIETEQGGLESSAEFLLPDYITGDFCLLHRLKPLSTNEEIHEAEELDIYQMRPTIGTARQHARYCPVGTVSYEFEKDDMSNQDSYFSKYIANLQNQRRNDNLQEYNEQDIELFRASFNNLGSERIYKKQTDGDAVSVIFNVESVGNQEAHQLVYDALELIRVKTMAILNHFEWNDQSGSYRYSDKKIKIARNSASGNTEITIHYEDHTIGNLISTYLKKLFITNKPASGQMLSFASYKLPHPLEEKIVIIVGFKDGVDLNGLFKEYDLKPTVKPDVQAVQLLFIACSHYLNDLEKIKHAWSEKSGITEASYELNSENKLLFSSNQDRSNKI
jgi:DNA-directed RNA polymerase subunit L